MPRTRSIERRQRGVATIEYALLVALISLAVVMGLSLLGVSISTQFGVVAGDVASLFEGSGSAGSAGSTSGGQGNGKGNGHGAGNGGQNNGNGSGGQDNGTGNGK